MSGKFHYGHSKEHKNINKLQITKKTNSIFHRHTERFIDMFVQSAYLNCSEMCQNDKALPPYSRTVLSGNQDTNNILDYANLYPFQVSACKIFYKNMIII